MLRRLVLVLLLVPVFALALAPARAEALRIGVLPVLDTLPLRVAVQNGLFTAHGLDVELVPFASAMERDTAMASGELDGYFGDMIATLALIRAGVPMRMVTVSYATTPGRRMFALAASPKGPGQGAPLGYSSTTVMEFLLDLMAPGDTVAGRAFTRMEVKKIPIRTQMLLAGQLGYAILPEPLVSLVESRGGAILATDADLGIPLTVVCLARGRMDVREPFLAAYAEALAALRGNPEAHRALMVRACRVPKPLAADFPLPAFPDPHLPSPAAVDQVQDWMLEKGLLDTRLPYAGLVGD